MTEPRAVEHNHLIVLRRQIDQAAGFEILDHAAIAVKQNQRPTLSALHVVQSYPVDLDELPLWRIIALRLPGKLPVHDGRCRKKTRSRSDCSCRRVVSENGDAVRQERG
jgi:hypothetical protein